MRVNWIIFFIVMYVITCDLLKHDPCKNLPSTKVVRSKPILLVCLFVLQTTQEIPSVMRNMEQLV
jgi:hypothetical protein